MAELVVERVELNGAECDVLRAGDGDELIVFLHAVGGDRTSWRAQLVAAPPRYTAVALDFRGHGAASPPPMATISVEQFARDVIALIDRMGFGSAHLVGLSMGGVVAQLVHRLRPELVATLTLASTWAHYGEPEAAARNAYVKDRLSRVSMMEGSRADMQYLLAPGTPAEVLEEAARVEGSKDPPIFLASWLSMFAVDLRPDLARVTAPTLLLSAELDPVVPAEPYLASIARAIPTARHVTLLGAGHFSNLDHPATFNHELYAFLRGNPAPAGRIASALPPPPRAIAADTTAHALIHLLSDRGVDVLFSNSGTDYVDIIDALARYEDDPAFRLHVVTVPHENTMIAMAHGYFLATGRTQAVMGHVNVGSANMMLGIINAARSHIPVLVMAGRTPHYDEGMPGSRVNFVQWGQDTFDQASFREFLKWDYELKSAHNLETVVDRALAIAQSDPAGPVYLTLPGEVLASKLPGDGRFEFAAEPRQRAALAGVADTRAIEAAAIAIARAKNPLIITAELGRYRSGPAALVRLAERGAVPVVEFGKHNFMNFPTSHPMHWGFDPVPAVRDADLVIAVECHVPWIPLFAKLPKPPRMIAVGVDPLAAALPMRAFPADIVLAGNPSATLLALADALPEDDGLASRRASIAQAHRDLFERTHREADADAALPTITKRFLSRAIGKVVDHDTLIFNEYDLDPTLVPRDEPGGWFENSIASGLGWALGAALGAKLAMPERTVVATVGDGSYLFNVPLAAHYVAAAERLPILIIIFNDRGYSTIKRSYRGAKPQGFAAKSGRYALCDFDVAIDFEKVAESCGGIGLRAETPSELHAVLGEALRLVRSGDRHVLVNVLCEKDDG